MTNERIEFRVSKKEKKFLQMYAESRGIYLSELMRQITRDFLAEVYNDDSVQNLAREYRIKMARKHNSDRLRVYLRDLYLPKNIIMDILRINCTSVMLTGDVNTEATKGIIDRTLDIYALFPKEIRKTMQKEIAALQSYQDYEHLKMMVNNSMQSFIQDMRGLE